MSCLVTRLKNSQMDLFGKFREIWWIFGRNFYQGIIGGSRSVSEQIQRIPCNLLRIPDGPLLFRKIFETFFGRFFWPQRCIFGNFLGTLSGNPFQEPSDCHGIFLEGFPGTFSGDLLHDLFRDLLRGPFSGRLSGRPLQYLSGSLL